MRHVDGASLWNLLKALESGGVAVPWPFGDRLVGGNACVAVRRCRQEAVNKLAPLCCGRWGFCQAAPVTAGHIASLGPLFNGALAAILAVSLDIALESSRASRAESMTDCEGRWPGIGLAACAH